MVSVVRSEWHRVEKRCKLFFDKDLLAKIYPDMEASELEELVSDLESGQYSIDSVVENALDQDIDLDWEHMYDDWITERKGGYDVTYELEDNS
jgi:hypothetical protein